MILAYSAVRLCRQAIRRRLIFIHLLIISPFCCFHTASHYGNQLQILQRDRVYYKKGTCHNNKNMFCNMFLHITTCDFGLCEGSRLSQSMESLLSPCKKKNLADNLPTSARQPHLTTYQLLVMQTLCGVQGKAG